MPPFLFFWAARRGCYAVTMGGHKREKTSGKKAPPRNGFFPALGSWLELVLGSIPFWWALCIGVATMLAWSGRQSMNPDGLSYLDMASAAVS